MHDHMCICDEFRSIETRTRLALIMHQTETHKPTNTGRVALRTLTNSELFVRGQESGPACLASLADPERRTLILFPAEDAVELTQAFVDSDPRPITLAVPDGTWGQARRAVRREPALQTAIRVVAPPGPPSRYLLRKEHEEHGLATIEAIARAFGVLEGPHVQDELERIFDIMVSRTMLTRQMPPIKPRAPGEKRRRSWEKRPRFEPTVDPDAATSAPASASASAAAPTSATPLHDLNVSQATSATPVATSDAAGDTSDT